MQRIKVRCAVSWLTPQTGKLFLVACALVGISLVVFTACRGSSSYNAAHNLQSPFVNSLSAIGSDYAWISTKNGQMLRTINGGITWSAVPFKEEGGAEILYFLDSKQGWMVSRHKKDIWQTIDGGNSWQRLTTLKTDGRDNYVIPLNELWFVDSLNGWIIDSTSVWRTENGGREWQRYYPTISDSLESGELIYCGRLATQQIGWVGGSHGVVFTTNDGGKNWQAKQIAPADVSFTDSGVANSNFGWLAATNGQIYFTEDQGKTWTLQSDALNNGNHLILSTYFMNKTRGWAVGRVPHASPVNSHSSETWQVGLAFHTVDGGIMWRPMKKGLSETILWRVYFVTDDIGWIVGNNNLYRTIDGGNSWTVSFSK